MLRSADEIASELMNFVAESQRGCYVDTQWYDWDEIKHLWLDAEEAEEE